MPDRNILLRILGRLLLLIVFGAIVGGAFVAFGSGADFSAVVAIGLPK